MQSCSEAGGNSSHSLETTSTDNPFHVRSRYCQEFRRATLQLLRLTAQSKSPASVIQKEKLERSKKERCSKGKLHHKPLRTSTHTHYVPKLARPRQRASDDAPLGKACRENSTTVQKISVRPSRPERPAPLTGCPWGGVINSEQHKKHARGTEETLHRYYLQRPKISQENPRPIQPRAG